jgi:hypothetical protein
MRLRALFLLPVAIVILHGQAKYAGPKPSKPDLPYLVHADNLVETEATEAKEEKGKGKDEIIYVVAGASSPAKTPLSAPILLIQTAKLQAERLQLYKLETKNGRREISFSPKSKNKNARPLIINVNRLTPDNVYKIEVDVSLENGEYALTPEGSNQVFCFSVY